MSIVHCSRALLKVLEAMWQAGAPLNHLYSTSQSLTSITSSSPLAIPPPPPPSALAASPPILAYSSSLSAHSTNTPSSSTASSSSGNTNTRRVASFTAHNQQSSGAGRPTRRAHASNPNPNAQKARATTDHNSFKATTSEGHIMLGLWPYMVSLSLIPPFSSLAQTPFSISVISASRPSSPCSVRRYVSQAQMGGPRIAYCTESDENS